MTVALAAGAAAMLPASELESGLAGSGPLGEGVGKWRLAVESDLPVAAMSVLENPTGHLTNLSGTAARPGDGDAWRVPLFPAMADPYGRQGFVRVVNATAEAAEVAIKAVDDTGRAHEALVLRLGAGEARHFNSEDLELGNAAKGLTGSTGAGGGNWRLALSGGPEVEVLAYVRTTRDGFVTAMHETAPGTPARYRVATFNPGRNANQVSALRLVNPGAEAAWVRVTGTDDAGGLRGALGTGAGK